MIRKQIQIVQLDAEAYDKAVMWLYASLNDIDKLSNDPELAEKVKSIKDSVNDAIGLLQR